MRKVLAIASPCEKTIPRCDEIVHAIKEMQKAIENDESIDTTIGPPQCAFI